MSAKLLDEVKRYHERQMTKWASKRHNQQDVEEDTTMKSNNNALSIQDETRKDTKRGAINARCQEKWAKWMDAETQGE